MNRPDMIYSNFLMLKKREGIIKLLNLIEELKQENQRLFDEIPCQTHLQNVIFKNYSGAVITMVLRKTS